jgi:NitT/TauT family transport system substrate-binding protein
MQLKRRRFLAMTAIAPLLPLRGALAETTGAADVDAMLIRLNLPGPGSLPFLPLELIPILGFDREMGTRLVLRYHPSGIRALEDMLHGNADFAALGFPTLPVLQSRGKDVIAIAPIAGTSHTFHMMVRKDLASRIRRIEDLKGRTIGVSTGSPSSKTYMQMLTEILLGAHGIGGNQIRWLPTGQHWESISGALVSQAADAVLCEQPFPARLMRASLAVSLADFNDPRIQKLIPGSTALRSALVAPRKALEMPEMEEKGDRMVRMLRRSLVWMQATPPESIARQLKVRNEDEREELARLLQAMPGIYSADVRFVAKQIEATDQFLRAAHRDRGLPPAASLVSLRWAGQK